MPPANKKTAAAAGPRRRAVVMPPVVEIRALAEIFHKGGLTPKNVDRPEQLAVRIIAGFEIGLTPVQSVNNILVVNGRASIWGDAALALVLSSGLMPKHDEDVEGTEDDRFGYCTVKRAGRDGEVRRTFSVAEAKTAKLWRKEGPWTTYPDRMLKMRARAFALRDVFADVLCGLGIVEEQQDVPAEQPARKEGDPVPAAAGPVVADPDDKNPPPITEGQLRQLGEARPAWLRSIGVNPDDDAAVKAAWSQKLAGFATDSAKKLDQEQFGRLLADLRQAGNQQEIKELFPQTAA